METASFETKIKHVKHRKSKVSEIDGFRTILCVDCNEIFTVKIDG